MVIDILQTIIDYSNLKDQIHCIKMDKYIYGNLYIYQLDAYKYPIDQDIIEKKYFRKLRKLNCSDNRYITSIKHLSNTLEVLDCSNRSGNSYCAIGQNDINYLKNLNI